MSQNKVDFINVGLPINQIFQRGVSVVALVIFDDANIRSINNTARLVMPP